MKTFFSKKTIFLIFICIVMLVFFRSFFNPYVYDSTTSMEHLGWKLEKLPSFSLLFSPKEYCPVTGELSYRPLSTLVYMVLDARLFSFQPWLSHGFSLLLHALNGFLLYLLLREKDEKNNYLPLIASLMFLVHPLVSEAVLCVGFREDLLALSFILLSFVIYKHMESVFNVRVIIFIFLLFCCAFFSKEIGVVIVPLFPLFIFIFTGNLKKSIYYGMGLFFLFTILYYTWRIFQYTDYPTDFFGGQGRFMGVVNFLASIYEVYLSRLFIPYPMRIDYHFDPISALFSIRVLMVLMALGCLLVTWGSFARKSDWVLFGGAWVFFSFLPLSQIIPVPDPVAERLCYVPMVGVAMIFYGLLTLVGKNWIRQVQIISCVGLFCLGVLSAQRCWDWQDEITLNIRNWEMADDQRPIANRSLGALYLKKASNRNLSGEEQRQDFSRSFTHLQLLLEQSPHDFEGNRLMALWYVVNGDKEKGREFFLAAKKIDGQSSDLQRLEILFQGKSDRK